jgi:pyruvate formate lyase activating enzyme
MKNCSSAIFNTAFPNCAASPEFLDSRRQKNINPGDITLLMQTGVMRTKISAQPVRPNPVRIGGVQKHSLIDYPGKISAVLFLTGCNLKCPYCHNPALARGEIPGWLEPGFDEFLAFLHQRRGFLDGVVISGGEPTLQAGLVEVCGQIRALGYPVKLDTNGSRPRMLKQLLDAQLVNYIAMDIKTDPLLYRRHLQADCHPSALLESIRLILDSGIDHEFRTTCVKPIVKPVTIETIARLIAGAQLYMLQQFRNTDILRPDFFQDGKSHLFTPAQLDRLKATASRQVACCQVR